MLLLPIMSTHHTVVWLDHSEARIFNLDAETIKHIDSKSPTAQSHVHNKSSVSGRRGEHDLEHYYRDIVQALAESAEVLVVGPSTAKLELVRYAHKHHADLEKRITGLETVDHPTDGQLVAYAKKYFIAAGSDAVNAQ